MNPGIPGSFNDNPEKTKILHSIYHIISMIHAGFHYNSGSETGVFRIKTENHFLNNKNILLYNMKIIAYNKKPAKKRVFYMIYIILGFSYYINFLS